MSDGPAAPHLYLRTFGTPGVEGAHGPVGGIAAQRQGLALLAVLAAASDTGVTRDRLMLLIWPDAEPRRAAHRLNQLVHALRRALAAPEAICGTAELRLNARVIASDRQAFAAASRSGDLDTLASLYVGPFLDGFHLPGALEFERWVDEERAMLARVYAEALETLALRAEAAGDPRGAAAWWSWLARHDPLSSRVAIHAMRALAASGDRAAALRHAADYEALIRSELEADPNPAVRALAAELRHVPSPLRPSVAVLPFAPLAPSDASSAFAEGLAEEISTELTAGGAVRVASRTSVSALRENVLDVREIGRRLGVTAVLEGTVRAADGRARVTARLVSTADGCELWAGRFEHEVGDVFGAQEEVGRRIAVEVGAVMGADGGGR